MSPKTPGDVPPKCTIQYSPPDVDNPSGKSFVITSYHPALVHVVQGGFGAAAVHLWKSQLFDRYSTTNCGNAV